MDIQSLHTLLIGLLIGALIPCISIFIIYVVSINSKLKSLNDNVNMLKSLINDHHDALIINNSTDRTFR